MKYKHNLSILLSVVGLALFVLPGITAISAAATPSSVSGAVFTQTNSASGNAILAFSRSSNGLLTVAGQYSTHGLGTGAGLGDQGALALSGGWLFAVNAGSNQISVFKVSGTTLKFTDIASSRGVSPISVTVHGNVVYVVNAGNATTAGNIAGFRVSPSGILHPIAGSIRSLELEQRSRTGAGLIQSNRHSPSCDREKHELHRYLRRQQLWRRRTSNNHYIRWNRTIRLCI